MNKFFKSVKFIKTTSWFQLMMIDIFLTECELFLESTKITRLLNLFRKI